MRYKQHDTPESIAERRAEIDEVFASSFDPIPVLKVIARWCDDADKPVRRTKVRQRTEDMMWMAYVAFSVVAVLVLAYFVVMAYAAYHSADQAPRRDMFICDTHGPMAESYTVKLFDGQELDHVAPDGITIRGPVRMCPICFENRIQEAKKHGG